MEWYLYFLTKKPLKQYWYKKKYFIPYFVNIPSETPFKINLFTQWLIMYKKNYKLVDTDWSWFEKKVFVCHLLSKHSWGHSYSCVNNRLLSCWTDNGRRNGSIICEMGINSAMMRLSPLPPQAASGVLSPVNRVKTAMLFLLLKVWVWCS